MQYSSSVSIANTNTHVYRAVLRSLISMIIYRLSAHKVYRLCINCIIIDYIIHIDRNNISRFKPRNAHQYYFRIARKTRTMGNNILLCF